MVCLIAFVVVDAAGAGELRMLNVGEGQSLVLSADAKAFGFVIDTGSFARSGRSVARLTELNRKAPRRLILTHLHPDHASGIFDFVRAYPDMEISDNCHDFDFKKNPATDVAIRWVEEFLRARPGVRSCLKQGDQLSLGLVSVQVLWPPANRVADGDLNSDSLVLLVSSGGFRALLMGDAGAKIETELLARNILPKEPIDVLVAGHHGAADAGTPEFLEKLRPAQVWVSVNLDNHWGHAGDRDLERLSKPRAKVRTTAKEGELVITF